MFRWRMSYGLGPALAGGSMRAASEAPSHADRNGAIAPTAISHVGCGKLSTLAMSARRNSPPMMSPWATGALQAMTTANHAATRGAIVHAMATPAIAHSGAPAIWLL